MKLRRFIEVPSSIWPRPGNTTIVDMLGVEVALFNVDGEFFALSNFCIRCGAPLSSGTVIGTSVKCGCCGWTYQLASGRLAALPALGVDWFEVEMLQSRLLVAADPARTDQAGD